MWNQGAMRCFFCSLLVALSIGPVGAHGQAMEEKGSARVTNLPDSPDAAIQATGQRSGSVSGIVTDSDGDGIAGAKVTLSVDGPNGVATRTAIADGDGYFSLLNVPAGNVRVTIISDGFAPVTKSFALHPEEMLETPDFMLPVATAASDVEVSFSNHDIAEEEIRAAEKQRLVGFIPNFYVVYDWNAPPLSSRQKFKLSVRSMFDPANILLDGIIAGTEQATNAFPGYGQGAAGLGKRFGSTLADGTIGSFIGGAVFPVLLKQDPRYFYKGTGSIPSRALYALAMAFVCKGDNGKWQPNYSSVLGDVAGGAISNIYYPASDRSGWVETIEVGLLNAAEEGFGNLLQEFLFKRISTGIPRVPRRKP